MAICMIREYRVRPEGVQKVKCAIQDFAPYVQAKEPGTRMYVAGQQQDDRTHFVPFFIFEDELAHEAHSRSEAVKHFEALDRPELAGGEVVFTDCNLIATNQG